MSGWVCSYRAIWEHPIFKGNAERVGVWDWMVKKAVWKPMRFRVPTSGDVINLRRGQMCISQRQVELETGMSRQKFRTFLKELEAEGAVASQSSTKSTQGRTVITICNYDKYQAKETVTNPTSTQPQPNKEQGNNTSPIGEGADAPMQNLVSVSVVTAALWSAGKQYLAACGVKNPGAVIGRWLKAYDAVPILNAIEASQKSGTQDPVPYITEILKGGQHGRPPSARQRDDIALREFARRVSAGEIYRGPDPSDPFAG